MNINFTDKELSVIQLMEPSMTPEETCNKVLHDWYESNLQRMNIQTKTSDQIADDVLAVHTVEIAKEASSGVIT